MSTHAALATPAVPGTVPAVELVTSPDDSLTFELARALLDVAREQFVSDYERHGEAVAVYRFKQQVSHWSNQFAPELRGVARTVGNRMDGETHTFQIAWSRLLHWHEQDRGEPVSLTTLRKRTRIWAEAGGLEIVTNDVYSPEGNGGRLRNHAPAPKADPDRLGKDKRRVGRRGGKRMFSDDSHTFRVDFSKVIKSRRVYDEVTRKWHAEYYAEPWDFRQIGPESQPFEAQSPADDAAESSPTPPTDPQLTPNIIPVTPYCSPSVPATVKGTASVPVPAGQGENVGREGDLETDGETARIFPDPFNTYVVRTYRSGKRAYARLDRVSGLAAKGVASEKIVALSPAEASWMWHTWPAGDLQRQERHIGFLLATEDERAALIGEARAERERGTAAEQQDGAGEQEDPVDRVLEYLIENDELNLTGQVPEELSELGKRTVLDVCDKLAGDQRIRLCGSRSLRKFGLNHEGRVYLAQYFPYSTVWRALSRRPGGIGIWDLQEVADQYGLSEDKIREVLDEFVESEDAVLDGDEYRLAGTDD